MRSLSVLRQYCQILEVFVNRVARAASKHRRNRGESLPLVKRVGTPDVEHAVAIDQTSLNEQPHGFIVVTDGGDVRKRLRALGEYRWLFANSIS